MKKMLLFTIATLVSASSFAMSEETLTDCVMSSRGRTQTLYGLYQDVGQSKLITADEAQQTVKKVLSSEVKTCAQVDSILADVIAQALKRVK